MTHIETAKFIGVISLVGHFSYFLGGTLPPQGALCGGIAPFGYDPEKKDSGKWARKRIYYGKQSNSSIYLYKIKRELQTVEEVLVLQDFLKDKNLPKAFQKSR